MEMTDYDPVEQLRLVLNDAVPFDPQESRSWAARLDALSRAEGQIARLTYEAAIDSLLRRLIRGAQLIERRVRSEGRGEEAMWSGIRRYLSDSFALPSRLQEKVVAFLVDCTSNARKEPSKTVRRVARRRASRCYICGTDLAGVAGMPNSATLDHVSPHSLGGPSTVENLMPACESCNEVRADRLRGEDFHYERMSLHLDPIEPSFDAAFDRSFRVAVSLYGQTRCAVCHRLASQFGEMSFGRLDSDDSWHFLNIRPFCSDHAPEDP